MARSYLPPERRTDKLSPAVKADITFDLINAFGMVKNPLEAAMLLQDLLTKKELDNLSKRLQIAKLLLTGEKQDKIIERLHCGFGTIARVQTWIKEGGEGLRRIIARLPKRKEHPEEKLSALPPEYRMPQLIYKYIQYLRAYKEEKKIKQFLESVEDKALIDKQLRDALNDYYRNQTRKESSK